MKKIRLIGLLVAVGLAICTVGMARAESPADSLKLRTPKLVSANAMTFGPEGILFVGDTSQGTIFALSTGDKSSPGGKANLPNVEHLDEKIASLLGIQSSQLLINDLAVNPVSRNTYLSVSRGNGTDAPVVLIKVDTKGKVSELDLKGMSYAAYQLPNAAVGEKKRRDVITDIAYINGKVFVAGLSNEEFASNLRTIPFPFDDKEVSKGTAVEIYHGAHGKLETASPVRTFVPYDINGEPSLIAAYTCTPLVTLPVSTLKPGSKVKGTTVAELGNGNRPLDMIVYKKAGKEYLLLANSHRGVMKIPVDGLRKVEPIQSKINGRAGLNYETIESLKGVQHLDKFGDENALILLKNDDGTINLKTIDLP